MGGSGMSFDWNQVRAFLATAEEGSFSSAARALRTTQPTIGRQITALKETLNVTLLERTARGPKLTASGLELLQHVRSMGEAAALISLVASGKAEALKGEVAISATDIMSAALLPNLLKELHATAPEIHVQFIAENRIQNLTRRDADIAIRHARPDQPDLIARRVGNFRANLYAATDYLDSVRRPQTPRDIAELKFVGNPNFERFMTTLHDLNIPVRPENFVMSSESGMVTWELVKAGYGVSILPEVLGDKELGVEKVLSGLPSIEFPVWIVTHRELKTSRRIRKVFDCLAQALAELGR